MRGPPPRSKWCHAHMSIPACRCGRGILFWYDKLQHTIPDTQAHDTWYIKPLHKTFPQPWGQTLYSAMRCLLDHYKMQLYGWAVPWEYTCAQREGRWYLHTHTHTHTHAHTHTNTQYDNGASHWRTHPLTLPSWTQVPQQACQKHDSLRDEPLGESHILGATKHDEGMENSVGVYLNQCLHNDDTLTHILHSPHTTLPGAKHETDPIHMPKDWGLPSSGEKPW